MDSILQYDLVDLTLSGFSNVVPQQIVIENSQGWVSNVWETITYENNEDKPLQKKKVKKQKKKSKKVLQPFDLLVPPSHLLDSYYDLDLSEEFLSQVLKYVDDLCNFINNGDQNLERSMEVNENLNYAVSCYRQSHYREVPR